MISNEIKAIADTFVENEILNNLAPLGIPILSEESGYLSTEIEKEYLFIVDPNSKNIGSF